MEEDHRDEVYADVHPNVQPVVKAHKVKIPHLRAPQRYQRSQHLPPHAPHLPGFHSAPLDHFHYGDVEQHEVICEGGVVVHALRYRGIARVEDNRADPAENTHRSCDYIGLAKGGFKLGLMRTAHAGEEGNMREDVEQGEGHTRRFLYSAHADERPLAVVLLHRV